MKKATSPLLSAQRVKYSSVMNLLIIHSESLGWLFLSNTVLLWKSLFKITSWLPGDYHKYTVFCAKGCIFVEEERKSPHWPLHTHTHLIYSRLVPCKTSCLSLTQMYMHTDMRMHTHHTGEWGVDLQHVCEYYRSQGSFPRNLWHKHALSHYLTAKHSLKPPPMSLPHFTLSGVWRKKKTTTCAHAWWAHLHRKHLWFFSSTMAEAKSCVWASSGGQMTRSPATSSWMR